MELSESVTIVVPVSRDTHLDRFFAALELMDCNAEKTNLFVYVDGKSQLFLLARNYVQQSKFKQKLCIQRKSKMPPVSAIEVRRRRIAAIHNEIKQYLWDSEYILLLEDDTIIPTNALSLLMKDYSEHPHAGFITGVEVGRHKVNHLGLWIFDNVYDPSVIQSMVLPEAQPRLFNIMVDSSQLDAAGMYCALTRRDNYIVHEFAPLGSLLGPDVNWGIELRKKGFSNYVNWNVKCEHRTPKGEVITPSNVEVEEVIIKKLNGLWKRVQ